MTKQCSFLNPLKRDGTSQKQRLLDALLPENNPIDERSLEDLLDYLQQYASLLLYYDINNFPAGSWKDFIELEPPNESSEHPPHMALLLAFLQLFKYLQEHLNTLTAKHLDFYYQDTLQLLRKKEQPDQVHLVFELAKQIDQHRLDKDTMFKAGKDDEGTNRFYANDEELLINQATLSEEHGLKTVFIHSSNNTPKAIHHAPIANSNDGLGEGIDEQDGKWATFGNSDMPKADIGFAVASPMLLLAEGTRTINIRFYLESLAPLLPENKNAEETNKYLDTIEELIKKQVQVFLSGEKEWMPFKLQDVSIDNQEAIPDDPDEPDKPKPDKPDKPHKPGKPKWWLRDHIRRDLIRDLRPGAIPPPNIIGLPPKPIPPFERMSLKHHAGDHIEFSEAPLHDDSQSISDKKTLKQKEQNEQKPYINFQIILSTEDSAVVNFDNSVLPDGFSTKHPVAKFLLVPPKKDTDDDKSTALDYLNKIKITSLDIRVDVKGVKNLILENDHGLLNPAKPFHPFGPVPRKGSKFYIGSNEVFQKSVQNVELNISWGDLPEQNFKDHYSGYQNNGADIVKDNCYFKAGLALLNRGKWDTEVYIDPKGKTRKQNKQLFNPCTGTIDSERTFIYKKSTERPVEIHSFSQYQVGVQYGFMRMDLLTSFLHNHYPTVLAEAIKSQTTSIPNTPYTPLITEITLDYTAKESIDYQQLKSTNFKNRIEQLFHIAPFGQIEFFPATKPSEPTKKVISQQLLSQYPISADDNKNAAGTLYIGLDKLKPPQNLSILFQVAESSADPAIKTPKVYWSYMVNNQWQDFKDTEILADKTNGLITSGIIRFAIPKPITDNNTLLPKGLYWIKASVENNTSAIAKLIAVKPQAVAASFRDNNNNLAHLGTALPADTISKLKQRNTRIKTISQPFASFNGQLPEHDAAFYRRVSERLRHKGRAITIFDYERLVLEQFPAIYKVKCINHTQKGNEFSPGNVKLVVVPDLRNKNAVNPLRPRATVNTLYEIDRYISRLTSDFVSVEVQNPQYEEIEVTFKVAFHEGYDQGFYLMQLEQDIIRFLSPWLYDDAADISFGGKIHRSWILNHVEEQSYVDFVTDFRMNHLIDANAGTGSSQLDVKEAIVQSSSSILVSSKHHNIQPADKLVCEEKRFGDYDQRGHDEK